jgi:hypothetical protein
MDSGTLGLDFDETLGAHGTAGKLAHEEDNTHHSKFSVGAQWV